MEGLEEASLEGEAAVASSLRRRPVICQGQERVRRSLFWEPRGQQQKGHNFCAKEAGGPGMGPKEKREPGERKELFYLGRRRRYADKFKTGNKGGRGLGTRKWDFSAGIVFQPLMLDDCY